MQAPEGYVLRLTEPTRSLEQNSFLHALLTDVGNMIDWKWCGYDVGLPELKSIFMCAYRKVKGIEERLIPGIDNQPVNLDWHTSNMTKRELSEFAELVHAWMSEYRANNSPVLKKYVDQ